MMLPFVFLGLFGHLTSQTKAQSAGDVQHKLPEGVELVDPKSLGLTDADLEKFLGNVKVLGGS